MLSNFCTNSVLAPGILRKVHHIALNVKDMQASRNFYGIILGLHELTGDEVPATLLELVAAGKVANFMTPDGTIIDLFGEPELSPPDPNPGKTFTRAYHLAFDIEPQLFEQAVAVIRDNQIAIAHGPVSRPTGRGVYFYDPDGFMIEIRCDPESMVNGQ
jgi:glyoxylase I family protein